jgi:heterodisulfide reductase subunit C
MEYTPRRVIAMVRAGIRDEVLSSSSQWQCLSCYLCSARCPREVKPADIMHVLERMAIDEGQVSKKTRTPIMYRSFVNSIKDNGRIHELGFMLGYYLHTNLFAALRLMGMALNMLSRGRIPLRAHKIKGKNELNLILDKARSLEDGQ